MSSPAVCTGSIQGRIQAVVLDLDGVVYAGTMPIPGAAEAIAWLRHTGRQVFFCSNNSSRSREHYALKLRGMGIEVDPANIMTSAYGTAQYLVTHGGANRGAYIIGEAGLRDALTAVGVRVVDDPVNHASIDYVIVGLDRQFTYQKLVTASYAIHHGAVFIATNRDATLPDETEPLPGGGALVSAVETATGKSPILIGKPEPYLLQSILTTWGYAPGDTLMIGDRLDTDIMSGLHAGTHTALVLTGISTISDIEDLPASMRPSLVLNNLLDLREALGGA